MYVVGTAGHVDHGKSTLVHALTGIDPDRLPDEKRRAMTIDLGFAWMDLPSGREVSIVDVPGHERFVRNMLAGVGGIDLALLAIAADEGVMPQTKEHLAILDLLRIERGIVVITKRDLVDEELLELAVLDCAEAVRATVLEAAPLITTSAVTGEGLPELVAAIDKILDASPARRDIDKPRLPIDRAFTIKGFGTVVTGTLIGGKLSVGQEVEISPRGLRAHIRGLQTHKRKIDVALPGSRVAVNLTGIAPEELERGFTITTPGWLKPTSFMDARLSAVSDLAKPIGHNAAVTFHTGTSEVAGKIRLLERQKLGPGESGWVQVTLSEPVAVAHGDLFIVRSPMGTIGGGEIIDPHPKRHRRFQTDLIRNLEAREKGPPADVLFATLEANEPAELATLLGLCSLSQEDAMNALGSLCSGSRVVMVGSEGPHALVFTALGWDRLAERCSERAQRFHNQFPLRRGMPKEQLRSQLMVPAQHFGPIIQRLVEEGILIEEGATVRLSSHGVSLSAAQQADADGYLKVLADNPYSPPGDSPPSPEILGMLLAERRVVRVCDGVIFSAAAYDEMVARIVAHLKSRGRITVAEVRDMFQTSRKYALALMEHLDQEKVTRRVGDERVLR